MRFHFPIVIVVLCIWCLPFQAKAECTWVFWIKTEITNWGSSKNYNRSSSWEISSVTKTKEECDAGLAASWQFNITAMQNVSGVKIQSAPGYIGVVYPPIGGEYSSMNLSFLCVPDTIDPRGPKQ